MLTWEIVRKFVVGVALLSSSTAFADVTLYDQDVEVSGLYMKAPTAAFDSSEPLVATGVHVRDRNGLYTAIVSGVLGSKCDDCAPSTYDVYDVHESPLGMFVTITHVGTVTATPETPEERQARDKAGREIGFGTNTYTDVVAYASKDGTSNVSGGSFAMGAAMFGNSRYALDIGFKWAFMKAGDMCGDEMAPTRCKYRYLGAPLDFMAELGPIEIDVGYNWNWRKDASTAHGSLGINLGNRVFVRGDAQILKDHPSAPMFTLEAGGRL
jgi:hypothetical protein